MGASWHPGSAIDKRATHFLLSRATAGPDPKAVLARTTQNLDTGEFFESARIVTGELEEDLLGPLPIYGKRSYCRLRTVLYYDPSFKQPKGMWVGGEWVRKVSGSGNPGVHPGI